MSQREHRIKLSSKPNSSSDTLMVGLYFEKCGAVVLE